MPAPHLPEFRADKLRRARIEKGLSQRDVWELSGVPHGTVNKLERSKRVPRLITLKKLAAAYDKPISYFLDDE